MSDIRGKLQDAKVAATFAKAFVDQYLHPAFGVRSKSEIDLLVFSCLVQAGAVDPTKPLYDLARSLNITPARARNLILNWQLRSTLVTANLDHELMAALQQTRFAKDGTLMSSPWRARSCERRSGRA